MGRVAGDRERPAEVEDASVSPAGAALAIALLALLAMLFRMRGAGRTLWIDELWVVEVLRGAVPPTPVPPLFLLLSRTAVGLFGFSEAALRFPALLGAALTLLIPATLLRLPRALTSRSFAVAWALLLAGSSPLCFYSTQLKQYSLDAAFGAAVLAAWIAFDAEPAARSRLGVLIAVCAGAVVATHPGILLAAPALTAAAYRRWTSPPEGAPRLRHASPALVAAGVCAAIFGLFRARAGAGPPWLLVYWKDRFWDGRAATLVSGTRHWVGQAMNLLPLGMVALAAALLLFVILGRGTLERRLLFLCVALAPALLCLFASRFQKYPYGEVRLMLFALPGLLAVLAAGIETAIRAAPVPGLMCSSLLAVLFVHGGVVRETYDSTYMELHDAREVNDVVGSLWKPGVAIVAPYDFRTQLSYYRPDLSSSLHSAPGDPPVATTAPVPKGRTTIFVIPEGRSRSGPRTAPGAVVLPLRGFRVSLDGGR